MAWGHGALTAGSEGTLSFIWGSHGHISFWSGGIYCNTVQFIRHAVYSYRLLEYLQNNRLVSSEDCYLDIYYSYTCAMLFNASGQAVWKLNGFMKQDLSISPYDILTLLLSMPDNKFCYSIINTNSWRDIFLLMFTRDSILQSKSRLPDTCTETLFYLTTVVSHFTVILLHLTIPSCNTKLVCLRVKWICESEENTSSIFFQCDE